MAYGAFQRKNIGQASIHLQGYEGGGHERMEFTSEPAKVQAGQERNLGRGGRQII